MSKALQVFNFEGNETRIVLKNGVPWWVVVDVCEVLNLSNPSEAIKALDDDEKNTLRISEGNRGNPNVSVINESGLYALIIRSNKPEAKKFRKWITSEVLPAIRKTGSYILKSKPDNELELARQRLALQEKNANTRAAKTMQRMIEHPAYPLTEDSKRILSHEIAKLLTGTPHIEMLPDASSRFYSAGDIGREANETNRKVMKTARRIGMVPPEGEANEYGAWKMTKSPHSPHECNQWFFNETGREKIVAEFRQAA